MNNRVKRITFIGVISAVAVILSYIEMLLPPIYSAVPGIKVGLPNIVIIVLLYKYGAGSAAAASFIRLIIMALLFNPLLKKTDKFSTVGVSVAGGVMHNLGQILVAMLLLETAEIGYYMFILAISGTLAGVFIGIAGAFLTERLKKY